MVEDALFRVARRLLGDGGCSVLLKRLEVSNREKLPESIYELMKESLSVFGEKGLFAISRQLGREMAKELAMHFPQERHKDIEREVLQALGLAQEMCIEEENYYMKGCVFYPKFLQKEGIKPSEHAVCYMCMGFIEGSLKEPNKVIKWKGREEDTCCFEAVRR